MASSARGARGVEHACAAATTCAWHVCSFTGMARGRARVDRERASTTTGLNAHTHGTDALAPPPACAAGRATRSPACLQRYRKQHGLPDRPKFEPGKGLSKYAGVETRARLMDETMCVPSIRSHASSFVMLRTMSTLLAHCNSKIPRWS